MEREGGFGGHLGSYDFNGDGTAVEHCSIKIGPTVFDDQLLLSSKACVTGRPRQIFSLYFLERGERDTRKGFFFFFFT